MILVRVVVILVRVVVILVRVVVIVVRVVVILVRIVVIPPHLTCPPMASHGTHTPPMVPTCLPWYPHASHGTHMPPMVTMVPTCPFHMAVLPVHANIRTQKFSAIQRHLHCPATYKPL